MPCYNAADTLNEALKSLVDQTLIDFEVIAVNDGSTDKTGDILAAWQTLINGYELLTGLTRGSYLP